MKINCCTYGNSCNDSSKLGHVLQDTTKLLSFFGEGLGNHELQTTWCFYRSVTISRADILDKILQSFEVKQQFSENKLFSHLFPCKHSLEFWIGHIDYLVFFIDTFFPRWSHLLTTKTVILSLTNAGKSFTVCFCKKKILRAPVFL